MTRNALRSGFTLLEMLVTLIILGILLAVVFPVVTQQLDDAEPTQAANDLSAVRTGIELFHLNVRPVYPFDVEDLVHQISTAEGPFTGGTYTANHTGRWDGPYIDAIGVEGADLVTVAFSTGFDLDVMNDFACFDPGANTIIANASCGAGHFVAIQLEGAAVSGTGGPEFNALDELIDSGGDGIAAGRLRATDSDGSTAPDNSGDEIIFYLAVPFQG